MTKSLVLLQKSSQTPTERPRRQRPLSLQKQANKQKKKKKGPPLVLAQILGNLYIKIPQMSSSCRAGKIISSAKLNSAAYTIPTIAGLTVN